MAKTHLSCLLLLALLLDKGYALSCYQCKSANPIECQASSPRRIPVTCAPDSDQITHYCSFKINYDDRLRAEVATSDCEPALRPVNWNYLRYNFCRPQGGETVIDCRTCQTNYCN